MRKTITLTLRKIRGGGVVGYAPFTLELQFMHLDKIPVIRPGAHPPKTPRISNNQFRTLLATKARNPSLALIDHS